MSEQQENHTGTACPVCGINGTCSHPLKYPPIPPWQPNVFVKSIPTDN
jgi:rRNA maturation protein Nop10